MTAQTWNPLINYTEERDKEKILTTEFDAELANIYGALNTTSVGLDALGSIAITPQAFPYIQNSAIPYYTSGTSITVDYLSCVNDSRDGYILKTSGTVVSLSSVGLNGVCQSSTLTGTITVSSGASGVAGTGTSFTTDYQVGDVISTAGAQGRRITSITNNTNLTVTPAWSSGEAGVSHKRGGRAPGTFYYLYAVNNGTPGTPGCVFSTRCVATGDTLLDLPTGYNRKRQLLFSAKTDDNASFYPFFLNGNRFEYRDFLFGNPYNLITGQTAIGYTTIDLRVANALPKIAKSVILQTKLYNNTGGGSGYLKPTGSASQREVGDITLANTVYTMPPFEMPLNSSQQMDYTVTSGAALTIGLVGFTLSGVV